MRIAVVSSLPTAGNAQSGVSYYAESLSGALAQAGLDVIVLANQGTTSRPPGTRLDAVWKSGFMYPFQVFRAVRARKIGTVLIEHTPFLYGHGPLSIFAFPLLLLLLRTSGCRVVTDLHDIRPLATIDPAFVKSLGLPVPSALLRLAFRMLFGSIARFSSRLIVHDGAAAETMVHDYGAAPSRVVNIALLPPSVELQDRTSARAALALPPGARCLLFFGYASAYKGLEILADALQSLAIGDRQKNLLVLVAAGPNPHLAENTDYQTYYEQLKQRLTGIPFVKWDGFVSDDRVPTYFAAADSVILPYTRAIGSSYPLAQAVAYGCPAFVSRRIPSEGYDADITVFEPVSAEIARLIEQFAAMPSSVDRDRSSGKSADLIINRYRAALSF